MTAQITGDESHRDQSHRDQSVRDESPRAAHHAIAVRAAVPGLPGAITVRPATASDAAAVAEIYNDGIRARVATFETTERTPDDVRAWFDASPLAGGVDHPFLVAQVEGGDVLGWVRASSYRSRACYAGIAEFSVYVAATARGRRIGDALMAAFIPACAAAGLWKLVSRIFPENAASRALCARHGFREVGTYEKHARLDGVWRDVVIVERLLPENLT
jgi:L-amino acid N-acyltransferase YncA